MKLSLSIIAVSALCATVAQSAVVYSSVTGTSSDTPNVASPGTQYTHYLESVTLAGASPVTLSTLDVSVHFNNYSGGSQDIYALIYTGANFASTTITGSANYVGGGAVVAAVPVVGSRVASNDYFYSFSLSPNAPGGLTFAPGTEIQVEFLLTLDGAALQFANSNEIVGNFTAGGATVGTNARGGSYTNTDNYTDFGPGDFRAGQSVRFVLNDPTPVPEPSTLAFSALAGCVLLGTVKRLRKSSATA